MPKVASVSRVSKSPKFVETEKQKDFYQKQRIQFLKHNEPLKKLETAYLKGDAIKGSTGSYHSAQNRIGITLDSILDLMKHVQSKYDRNTNLSIAYYPPAEKTYYTQPYPEEVAEPTPFLDTIATNIDKEGVKRADSYALLTLILNLIDKSEETEVLYDYNNYNHTGSIPLGSSLKIIDFGAIHVMFDLRKMANSTSLNLVVTSDLRQCVRAVSEYSALLPQFDSSKLTLDTVFLFEKWCWLEDASKYLFFEESDSPHFVEIMKMHKPSDLTC
jgi:hypothetical protein